MKIDQTRKLIIFWLCICSLLVFSLVVLGGMVRLSGSGLSMVAWKPVTGIFPPLTQTQWFEVFNQYRQFPEYRLLNYGMEIEEFKFIYLMEYAHRMLARLTGMVFLLPFLGLLLWRKIDAVLIPRLWALFALGAIQGGIGWYMVKSGLVDNPAVSQYRLTLHLLMAVLILAYMTRLVVGLFCSQEINITNHTRDVPGVITVIVIFTMIASGGMVAGTHAGYIFNTFPTMGDSWIPAQLFAMTPVWINFFENTITIQFFHRILALIVAISILAYSLRIFRRNLGYDRLMSVLMIIAVTLQIGLGITTLIHAVPPVLGVAHQAGAMLLLMTVLATYFRGRPLCHQKAVSTGLKS